MKAIPQPKLKRQPVYKDKFKYIAATRAWGIRILNEVWIDPSATPKECVKLIHLFDFTATAVLESAIVDITMVIKFQANGQHGSFESKPEMSQYWSHIRWHSRTIFFRWYATRFMDSNEERYHIKFEVKFPTTPNNEPLTKWFYLESTKRRFSNKELIKLLLKTI